MDLPLDALGGWKLTGRPHHLNLPGSQRGRLLAGLAALGLGAFLLLAVACIFVLPGIIVTHDQHATTPLTPADDLKAKNDVRQTLLQALGGLSVLTGAALGVWLTLRQVQVTQEGQITDRFTRAVDQLGSNTVDVRVGGIYALERIAKDSSTDRGAVIEVLTALVRNRSPWPPPDHKHHHGQQTGEDILPLRLRAADVQAAMTVLGRSAPWRDQSASLELAYVDLRAGHLSDSDLRHAYLEGANLEGAWLSRTQLQAAHLGRANLRRAVLRHCHLAKARLHDTDLQDAKLPGANLEHATLRNVNLHGADLSDARLDGARADRRTIWPEGFDPVTAGVTITNE